MKKWSKKYINKAYTYTRDVHADWDFMVPDGVTVTDVIEALCDMANKKGWLSGGITHVREEEIDDNR